MYLEPHPNDEDEMEPHPNDEDEKSNKKIT
jgi:hypothetical protein